MVNEQTIITSGESIPSVAIITNALRMELISHCLLFPLFSAYFHNVRFYKKKMNFVEEIYIY